MFPVKDGPENGIRIREEKGNLLFFPLLFLPMFLLFLRLLLFLRVAYRRLFMIV